MTIMLLGVGDGSHKPQLELVALWELPQCQLLGFFFLFSPKMHIWGGCVLTSPQNPQAGWMRADPWRGRGG